MTLTNVTATLSPGEVFEAFRQQVDPAQHAVLQKEIARRWPQGLKLQVHLAIRPGGAEPDMAKAQGIDDGILFMNDDLHLMRLPDGTYMLICLRNLKLDVDQGDDIQMRINARPLKSVELTQRISNMDARNTSTALGDLKADRATHAPSRAWAAIFHNVDGGNDIVMPGAFTKSMKTRSPAMLWQHKSDQVIGVWDEVRETPEGLFVKGRLLETTQGNDAYILAKAGALKGMSIGYGTKEAASIDRKTGVRQLKELDLWEVSLVTFPMNELAAITRVKAKPASERELEEYLRDVGYSQNEAKKIVAEGYKAIAGQRDVEGHELEGLFQHIESIVIIGICMPELTQEQITTFENWRPRHGGPEDRDHCPTQGKLDAFDEAKYDRIQETITKAMEAQQKADARAAAIEAASKKAADDYVALQEKQKHLEAALNRPVSVSTPEQKEQDIRQKANKLFNDFARVKNAATQTDLAEFAREYIKQHEDDLELKALTVNSDPNGGYLTMPEFGGIIETYVYETSPMRQLASVIDHRHRHPRVRARTTTRPAGAGWARRRRGPTPTPRSSASWPSRSARCTPCPTSARRCSTTPTIDVEAWLAGKVAEVFARGEATAFISGNGINKPRGILTYPAGASVGSGQVQQVYSGNASGFTYCGLIALQNALKEQYQANAAFLTSAPATPCCWGSPTARVARSSTWATTRTRAWRRRSSASR